MDEHSNIILDNIDAIVSICNYETSEVLYLNNKALNIYGDGIGKKCWEFLHNESKETCSFCPKNRINSVSENKKEFIWELKHPKTKKWYEAHSKIINYKEIKAILEISYDISGRKKDEKQILNFLNYQNIISSIANGFNSRGNFNAKLNKSLELLVAQLNLKSAVILEKIDDELKIANIWEESNEIDTIKKLLNTNISEKDFNLQKIKERGRIKSNNIEKDFSGKILSFFKFFEIKSVFMLPIKIEDEIAGYFILQNTNKNRKWHIREVNLYKTIAEIFSNGIRRRRNEDEILQSQKKLRQANASKDKFFSIIAHDLKNPIYNVVNLSTYLKENLKKWDEDKVTKFVKYISEASTQASDLLENLLTWASSQTGRINVIQEKINIKTFIGGIKVSVNNLLLDKNITFKTSYNSEHKYLVADRNMIKTVIRNLITNSIKYTLEEGNITVIIADIDENNQKHIKITIADTGVGIAKKDIYKLFTIDESLSTPGTNNETGTGLGLILCREFVEKHNGRIWAESQLGKGSQFHFTIPIITIP